MPDIRQWPEVLIIVLGSIGASVALGAALQAPITMRVLIGKTLVGAGLGASAAVLFLDGSPSIPVIASYGAAAALAILGVHGIERLFLAAVDRVAKRLEDAVKPDDKAPPVAQKQDGGPRT